MRGTNSDVEHFLHRTPMKSAFTVEHFLHVTSWNWYAKLH